MPILRGAALTIVLLVLCASTEALAQPARPWEEGATSDQRDQAHQIFSEGNDHSFKRDHARAIELYERALAVFDHPRIQLALARALIRVGRPADAHPHMVSALRWGAAPLDADEHAEVLELQAALTKQLGILVIRCRTEGARLSLDGKDVAPCPGEQRHVVMPGRHQVVGRKTGYLTYTGEAVADAGGEAFVDVELGTLVAVRERRWAVWKPWAVIAGGISFGLAGFGARRLATNNLDRYRTGIAALCGTAGCAAGSPEHEQAGDLEPIESRAKLQNIAAISLWVVGGAVVTTGVIAVIVNRERIAIAGTENMTLSPLISPDVVGVSASGGF